MDKTSTSSPSISFTSTVQEMFTSGTTSIQPEKTIKPNLPYPEYKPVNPDDSKFYGTKTVKAEKLVFKLR